MPLKLRSQILQFRNSVGPAPIENVKPVLQVRHASFSDLFAVFERANILHMQFHRPKQRVLFLVGAADIADAICMADPVVDSGFSRTKRVPSDANSTRAKYSPSWS